MSDTFKVNKGSDFSASFNWPNGSGGNADLTGYTVAIYDASTALTGFITATLTTANVGLITVAITWSETFTTGRDMSFRVKITSPGGVDTTTNELFVLIQ